MTKKELGLLAIVFSIISIVSVIIGYGLLSAYHCEDKEFLSHWQFKNGAYMPMADMHLTSQQACIHITGGISIETFTLGFVIPWFFFAMLVGIVFSDKKIKTYDEIPESHKLCQLHFTEMITSYLYLENFEFRAQNNLGKCDMCPRDATGIFIKTQCDEKQGGST